MIDLEVDIYDELDDLEDDEQGDLTAIVNNLVYQSIEEARENFASSVEGNELREKILSSDIVMVDEFHGYLEFDDETEELLRVEEQGVLPFSIRDSMLNSPAVKTSAEGLRYVIIPFRGDNRGVNILRLGSTGYQRGLNFALGTPNGFRTISDKSPLGSWQHPGIPANVVYNKINDNAQRDLDSNLREVMEDYSG